MIAASRSLLIAATIQIALLKHRDWSLVTI